MVYTYFRTSSNYIPTQHYLLLKRSGNVFCTVRSQYLNTSQANFSLQTVPWLRRSVSGLCLRRPEFDLTSVRIRFAVDQVAPVQVLLQVLLFPLSISFHQCSTLVTIYTSLLPEGKQTKSGNFLKMLLRKWESIGLKTASTLFRRVRNIAKSDY